MIYTENIFHISLMENRDGILTGKKKAKENKESNTHSLCKSMKHSFQNKKRTKGKINLTGLGFFLLKKSPQEQEKNQNLVAIHRNSVSTH